MTPYLTIYSAADATAMIALLAAVRGSAAIRADTSAMYLLGVAPYSIAANWTRLYGLSRLVAAGADVANAAVTLAGLDIDAERWQGCKYDVDQEHAFPRVPYPGDAGNLTYPRAATNWQWAVSPGVWDLDSTGTAVVPLVVFHAVLAQADAIIDGSRDRVLEAMSRGLTGQSTGSLSESYAQAAAAGAVSPLCERAMRLMARYRLASGEMI